MAMSNEPRMATDIPASITIPDRVESRLGALTFTDGFPDDATVEKVFDNLDFQRAVQAFLAAMPAASIRAQHRAFLEFGPANQTVLMFETLMDSRSLFLTANTESIYILTWLDLSEGPVVVDAPPGMLGIVDDGWFHYVADIGLAGPDKGQGGQFVFVGPDHRDETPAGDGAYVFRSNTNGNLLGLRGFVVDGDPGPTVRAVKEHLRIYPLAGEADRPPMNFVDVSGMSFNTIHPMDFSFFEEVNEVVQEEPNAAIDPETLGLLASIGIEKGKPFEPDARMKAILTEAADVGNATARAYRTRLSDAYFYPDSAWCTPFVGGSYLFERDGVRLLDARSFMFFYATGITPAMAIQMVGAGSAYAGAFVDANNRPLDGAQHYRLHLPPNIPAKSFWSLVLYDTQTRSMLQTDDPHPSIGSQKHGVQINPDTSVDIYFGPTPPAGPREQLGANLAWQGLDRDPAALRPTPTVVRQDLATQRNRTDHQRDIAHPPPTPRLSDHPLGTARRQKSCRERAVSRTKDADSLSRLAPRLIAARATHLSCAESAPR